MSRSDHQSTAQCLSIGVTDLLRVCVCICVYTHIIRT